MLNMFFSQRFNYMENAFFHHSQGTLATELWSGTDAWIRSVVGTPIYRYFWSELGSSYMPSFQQYTNSILAGASGN
jgi:hypothetical protein